MAYVRYCTEHTATVSPPVLGIAEGSAPGLVIMARIPQLARLNCVASRLRLDARKTSGNLCVEFGLAGQLGRVLAAGFGETF